jgi:hypothetical protein
MTLARWVAEGGAALRAGARHERPKAHPGEPVAGAHGEADVAEGDPVVRGAPPERQSG